MTTSNTTQGAKLLQEAVKCAQRIREIIDEENFPKDLLWIPTIRAHSSVIHDNLTALEQPTAPASPIKEGGVRAAANVCALATAEELHGLGFDRYEDDGREHITKKARQCALYAFDGFVPASELNDMKVLYAALSNSLEDAQADNAKLREVLEKINRKSSHDFDDDSIYTLSKSALQSSRVAEKQA